MSDKATTYSETTASSLVDSWLDLSSSWEAAVCGSSVSNSVRMRCLSRAEVFRTCAEELRQVICEDGTAPPLPEDGKCDAWTNKLVDDCRGVLCDRCMKAINERKDTEDMKAKTKKNGKGEA